MRGIAYLLDQLEEMVQVLRGKLGSSCCQYSVDVLHLYRILLNLRPQSTILKHRYNSMGISPNLHLPDGGQFIQRQADAQKLDYPPQFVTILGLMKVA